MVPGNVCGLAGPGLPELNLSLLATALQPPSKGTTMKNDKHGNRGNKEAKKPKQDKPKVSGSDNPFAGKPAVEIARKKLK